VDLGDLGRLGAAGREALWQVRRELGGRERRAGERREERRRWRGERGGGMDEERQLISARPRARDVKRKRRRTFSSQWCTPPLMSLNGRLSVSLRCGLGAVGECGVA